MQYLALALAVLLALGGLTAAIAFPSLTHERDVAEARVAELLKLLTTAQDDLKRATAATDTARAAHEQVIADLKAEVAKLERDLDACSSPDAVRARLRGLFARADAAGGDAGRAGV